ncbi:hypothetical protein [Aquimarina macrocephali]|uniref:hypothetical protein n=1 Tax=Aquimarina macrocephali TaxID=666563 RepID=UPI003F67EFE9
MIYDSIDIIPAKLFFKILQTGDVGLLSDENIDTGKLKKVWEELEHQHDLTLSSDEANKALKVSIKIEYLSAKYKSVNLAIKCLRHEPDAQLFEVLKNAGYQIEEGVEVDYDKIERENKAIEIIISRLQKKLPKQDDSKNNSLDEVIMTYCVVTNMGFIDSNKITLTQYYALINAGNQKIKALENGREG